MTSSEPVSIDHTCPDIDRVGEMIHRHVEAGSPDWEEAMELLEKLRRANFQLRNNATFYEEQARREHHKFLSVLHRLSTPVRLYS